jgi:hypothetical protein
MQKTATLLVPSVAIFALALARVLSGMLALGGCGASNQGRPTLPAPEYEDSPPMGGSDGGSP